MLFFFTYNITFCKNFVTCFCISDFHLICFSYNIYIIYSCIKKLTYYADCMIIMHTWYSHWNRFTYKPGFYYLDSCIICRIKCILFRNLQLITRILVIFYIFPYLKKSAVIERNRSLWKNRNSDIQPFFNHITHKCFCNSWYNKIRFWIYHIFIFTCHRKIEFFFYSACWFLTMTKNHTYFKLFRKCFCYSEIQRSSVAWT